MPSGRPIPSGPRAGRRRKPDPSLRHRTADAAIRGDRASIVGDEARLRWAPRSRQACSGAGSASLIGESPLLAPKRCPTDPRPRRHFLPPVCPRLVPGVPCFSQNI